MGVGNLNPSGTRNRFEEIVDYRRQQISNLNVPESDFKRTENEDFIVRRMTHEFEGFERVTGGCEWVNDKEKVIAETRHGVELRVKYHPNGGKYFFLVATTGEFNSENLALQHLDNYKETLRKILKNVYGEVRRKTGAWTSTEIEVNA